MFECIVGSEIIGIELISVKDIQFPFGVKIHFKDDFIITTPNSDGNTVETKAYNINGSIEKFKYLGNLVYTKV